MHSKWQIWDFFPSFNKEFLHSFNGVLGLNTFDPISLKMTKDFLVQGARERTIFYKMASEVNKNWIEEEFQTLSLFGNSDSFFIHQAHELNAELIEMISKLELIDRFLILSFESENASWKKIIKESSFQTLTIEAPRFWELNKLLDFTCNYLRLPLSFEAKNWILDSIENNLVNFYNSCCLIKLNHPESREVSLVQVQELLTLEKMDQFALASLYSRKKMKDFFEKIIPLEGDFEKMRGLFNFLQSHLIKIADTSYLGQKPRLTQYDKDIQNSSKLWSQNELMHEVERFSQWELLCKRKDTSLWHKIKDTYLRLLMSY
ncbi:MAG: hypothetical protein AB7I27_04330 [Bacteriovoracaceae bacterium]